jgi:hypothetical protein
MPSWPFLQMDKYNEQIIRFFKTPLFSYLYNPVPFVNKIRILKSWRKRWTKKRKDRNKKLKALKKESERNLIEQNWQTVCAAHASPHQFFTIKTPRRWLLPVDFSLQKSGSIDKSRSSSLPSSIKASSTETS